MATEGSLSRQSTLTFNIPSRLQWSQYYDNIFSDLTTNWAKELGQATFDNACKNKDHSLFQNRASTESGTDSGLSKHSGDFERCLVRLRPAIRRIYGFIEVLQSIVTPASFEFEAVWGLLAVLVQNIADSKTELQHLQEIYDTFSDVAHYLDNVRIFGWMLQMAEVAVGDIFIELYAAFIEYLVHIMKYTKWARDGSQSVGATPSTKKPSNSGNYVELAWKQASECYLGLTLKNKRWQQRLETKAAALKFEKPHQAPSILRQLRNLDVFDNNDTISVNVKDNLRLPCHTIPFAKNRRFFERTALLDALRTQLDHNEEEPEFRSFVLWGMPGIGKTQTALAYAYERKEKGTPQVFWINAELPMDILKGFTKIAMELNMRGVKPDTHEQNKIQVLFWLERTDVPWLLIFDNVENPVHLKSCWPNSACGSVLITARDSVLSVDLNETRMQVPSMTKEEGRDFLMKVVNRGRFSDEETGSAEKLSEHLEGWPLALFQSGQTILLTRKRINVYLKDCEREPRHPLNPPPRHSIQNPYYPWSIENVFKRSFDFLGTNSSALLEVICFIAPVSIPDDMFEVVSSGMLPPKLAFCGTPAEQDKAMSELLSTSLVAKDEDTFEMSIHRLTQAIYRDSMDDERKYACFLTTAGLLRHLFPQQEKGRSLRNRFPICRAYIGHVLALCERCRDFMFRARSAGDFQSFSELASSCAWYLMEIGSWAEFWIVANLALEVSEDDESLHYSALCNVIGQLHCELGRAAEGRPYLQTAMKIRERLLPPDHEDLSDTYNNYANIINVQWENDEALDTALEYYKRAIDIDATKPKAERDQILHVRHLNFGTLYTCQERWDKAWAELIEGQKYTIQTFGPNKHWDATAEYKLANVLYFQEKWEDARPRFERALAIYQLQDKLHPTTTATQLKLATIKIKVKLEDSLEYQKQLDEAIDMLSKARLVCELREVSKGDKGDTARFTRRLADAWEAKGDLSKADTLREEAEAIREEIQGARFRELRDCERSYNLMVYKAFW